MVASIWWRSESDLGKYRNGLLAPVEKRLSLTSRSLAATTLGFEAVGSGVRQGVNLRLTLGHFEGGMRDSAGLKGSDDFLCTHSVARMARYALRLDRQLPRQEHRKSGGWHSCQEIAGNSDRSDAGRPGQAAGQ